MVAIFDVLKTAPVVIEQTPFQRNRMSGDAHVSAITSEAQALSTSVAFEHCCTSSSSYSCSERGQTGTSRGSNSLQKFTKAVEKTKRLGKGCANTPRGRCVFLLSDHWLEVFDPLHRCHLKPYLRRWLLSDTSQNFFHWLEHGDGRSLDLEERPRRILEKQRVKYCTPAERDYLEVVVGNDGLLRYKIEAQLVDTGSETLYQPGVDTNEDEPLDGCDQEEAEELAALREQGSDEDSPVRWVVRQGGMEKCLDSCEIQDTPKSGGGGDEKNRWIYVLDMQNRLYINQKLPGRFHHSSFVCGEPLRAAGSISVVSGRISIITAWSGHYRPSHEAFAYVIRYLHDRGVDMSQVRQYFSKSEIPGLKKASRSTKSLSRGSS